MLKVFNPLLQLVTTQMYGYEILCSNGAWRGREITINPPVLAFNIFSNPSLICVPGAIVFKTSIISLFVVAKIISSLFI